MLLPIRFLKGEFVFILQIPQVKLITKVIRLRRSLSTEEDFIADFHRNMLWEVKTLLSQI